MAVSVTKGIFIVGAKRTAFGSYGGVFKNTSAAELLTATTIDVLKSAGISPEKIDTVNFGNVTPLSAPDGALLARHVALKAGVPLDKPALSVNRLCGSGFQAVINGAQDILTGMANIALTGGSESMSMVPHVVRNVRFGAPLGGSYAFEDALATASLDTFCNLTMPLTAENLAKKYEITRQEVDEFSLRSQQNCKKAQEAGIFDAEITPYTLKVKNKEITVTADEHPRPNTTIEGLAKLPLLFRKDGVGTAGNSSGINDGAGTIILATEEAVKQNNLKPLARLLGWATVGVDPAIMGIGPVPAIESLLNVTNTTFNDIDLFEINEAFASQTLACVKALKLDMDKLNLNGGAIALGHPIAASGARITGHLAYELRRRGLRRGIGSACIGGGQGIAIMLESV